jgi:hypothetical protein
MDESSKSSISHPTALSLSKEMGDITVKTEAKHISYIQKTRVILAELYNMLTENLDNIITDMIKQKRDLITEHITCEIDISLTLQETMEG